MNDSECEIVRKPGFKVTTVVEKCQEVGTVYKLLKKRWNLRYQLIIIYLIVEEPQLKENNMNGSF